MSHAAPTSLTRQLGALFQGGSMAGLSDRELLDRFAIDRDQPAFAAIVARHGPMVLGVCRQLLADHQHAEDAFQAVFLVLARKAGSLRDPDRLGNWLYGVALRTSRKARTRRERSRRIEEAGAVDRPEAQPAPQADAVLERERAEALHDEIARLPNAFRAPVLLCYFEGLSLDEASARLRCPDGTIRSRLVRARERLRRGLSRRGFALSGAAVAAVLTPRSARASVSPLLCDATTRAAVAFAARHAADVGAISTMAREVLRIMIIQKARTALMSLLAAAALAAGAGMINRSTAMGDGPMPQPAAKVPSRPHAEEGRMTVTGRVIGLDGRPAPGAAVGIIAAPRTPMAANDDEREGFVVLGQGAADGDGRFRIEASRSSSSLYRDVYALAGPSGPGSAFGCVSLATDAERPSAEIHLQPEQVIRGRLVDIQGQPAAGVEINLRRVHTDSPRLGGGPFDGPIPGHPFQWSGAPKGLRAWPRAVTDPQGRFALAGIPRGLDVWLSVRDPRYAPQEIPIENDARDASKALSVALRPTRTIEGRTLASDTGQPIPGTVISVISSNGQFGVITTTKFRADERGHFRMNPTAGDYFRLYALAPEGRPYIGHQTEFTWTKGAVRMEKDLTLTRGVLLAGKVTEQENGRPVAGASVRFYQTRPSGDIVEGLESLVRSQDNGSFQLAVPPGKGHLTILGPSLDFLPEQISGAELFQGRKGGGWRILAHAIIPYDVRPGEGPHTINATLRRGNTMQGRLAGPSGETVEEAVILSRNQIDPLFPKWAKEAFLQARGGRFELHGLDPEESTPVYFLDQDHAWGAVVELSGQAAESEPTVRLQPCGRARMRFVGPDGKPVAKLKVWSYLHIIMTPGPVHTSRAADHGEELMADGAFLPLVAPRRYPGELVTDADGRVTLDALIPGAPYRVTDWSTVNEPKGLQLRRDFQVKPGETVDLDEILVEKPQDG